MPSLFQQLGITESKEERERRLLSEQSQTVQGLLGTAPQQAVTGELGRFGVQLQPAQEGTGYLGSDRGEDAQKALYMGATQAGYTPQQARDLISTGQAQPQQPTTFQRDFSAYQQADEATRRQMEEFKRAGAQNINMGTGAGSIWTNEQKTAAGIPVESVVTQDRYGKPQILSDTKYTQPQILSGTYAARMNDATETITKLMSDGFEPAGIVQNADLFGVPSMVANFARSDEGQQYRQAQENWISANLRKESGAAIPEDELDREIKKWFPQPGDKPNVIAQKYQARQTAARGMQKAAGGAYQELIDRAESDRLSELRKRHAK